MIREKLIEFRDTLHTVVTRSSLVTFFKGLIVDFSEIIGTNQILAAFQLTDGVELIKILEKNPAPFRTLFMTYQQSQREKFEVFIKVLSGNYGKDEIKMLLSTYMETFKSMISNIVSPFLITHDIHGEL